MGNISQGQSFPDPGVPGDIEGGKGSDEYNQGTPGLPTQGQDLSRSDCANGIQLIKVIQCSRTNVKLVVRRNDGSALDLTFPQDATDDSSSSSSSCLVRSWTQSEVRYSLSCNQVI
jgi:hypothetical protein